MTRQAHKILEKNRFFAKIENLCIIQAGYKLKLPCFFDEIVVRLAYKNYDHSQCYLLKVSLVGNDILPNLRRVISDPRLLALRNYEYLSAFST